MSDYSISNGRYDELSDSFVRLGAGSMNRFGLVGLAEGAIERLTAAKAERDKAIAHDRQPYPTASAYENVCKARAKWQVRAEKAEAENERLKASVEKRDVQLLAFSELMVELATAHEMYCQAWTPFKEAVLAAQAKGK